MKSKSGSLQKLLRILQKFRRQKRKVVFTNGTFDYLHAGHVRYLNKARRSGDFLVVGVNTDRSVKSYKGPLRPINPQEDRVEVLSSLACVDFAILFDEPTPIGLILKIKPDVLVKGADWKKSQIAGAKEVESWGGRVQRIPMVEGRSTTAIIKRISAAAAAEKS